MDTPLTLAAAEENKIIMPNASSLFPGGGGHSLNVPSFG